MNKLKFGKRTFFPVSSGLRHYFQAFALSFLAAFLIFAAPDVIARYRSVDNVAALKLSEMDKRAIGPALVQCMNAANARLRFTNEYDPFEAYPEFGEKRDADSYTVTGRLGWHITWALLITLDSDPISAYDTFEAEEPKFLFRQKTTWKVIGSLKQCGVHYEGDFEIGALVSSISP